MTIAELEVVSVLGGGKGRLAVDAQSRAHLYEYHQPCRHLRRKLRCQRLRNIGFRKKLQRSPVWFGLVWFGKKGV